MDLPFSTGAVRQIPLLTFGISRSPCRNFATTSELTMADDPSAEWDEWILTASTRIALVLDYGGKVGGISVFDPSAFPMAHRHCGGIYSDPDNLFVDKHAVSCDFLKERETQIDSLSSGFPRSGFGKISTDNSR